MSKKKSGLQKLTQVIVDLTLCVLAIDGLIAAIIKLWHTLTK